MKIMEGFHKTFLSLILQCNLHRKIELDIVYDAPQREIYYTLVDYTIEEHLFEGNKYINFTMTLAIEDGTIFTYPIPWISDVEYEPEGTLMQDKIKVWITVTNIAKKRNYDFHIKHGIMHLLKKEDINVYNKTRLFVYPDFSDFESIIITTEEGLQINMAEIVHVNPIFKGRSFKKEFNKVAVLIPFQKEFTDMYNNILVPLINELGFEVRKGDDFYDSNIIIEDIWRLINESNVIIADLTGKNPNVFYEVGIAHALGKHVVLLSQNPEDIPFDLRHLRHITYSLTLDEEISLFRRDMSKVFQEVKARLNIPRDIQDAIISEEVIYDLCEKMNEKIMCVYEENSCSFLLFTKEENLEKVISFKNQSHIFTMQSYNERVNSLVICAEGIDNYIYDEIVVTIPINPFYYEKLKEVVQGKSGVYLVVVNLENRVYSMKAILYEEMSRIVLQNILDKVLPKSIQ